MLLTGSRQRGLDRPYCVTMDVSAWTGKLPVPLGHMCLSQGLACVVLCEKEYLL